MTRKRPYNWHIPPEQRAELNKRRGETMRRGLEAARQRRKDGSVNTATPTTGGADGPPNERAEG